MGSGLIGGVTLCHPYRKGVGETLLKQWGIICCLTDRWEGVTSKTARDGNKSLFGATSRLLLSLRTIGDGWMVGLGDLVGLF